MSLTREQIEQMPAGRELDGHIVENIFGFKRCLYGKQTVFESPQYQQRKAENPFALGGVYSMRDVKGGRESVLRGEHPKEGWPTTLIDFYSTDIAAAWQVHLAICDRLFSVRQRYFAALSAAAPAVAWPDVLMVLRHDFPAYVCRAALLASI